jgi:hypothetical protein
MEELQSCARNIYKNGTYLKEKALHIAACVGTRNLFVSNDWVERFKRW